MTQTEALKLALEALELAKHSHGKLLLSDPPQEAWKTYGVDIALMKAIIAIREALADHIGDGNKMVEQLAHRKPLTDEEIADAVRDLSFPSITAIARAIETKIIRNWVGLTEDERTAIREAVQQYHKIENWNYAKAVQFATELKLQEKNS